MQQILFRALLTTGRVLPLDGNKGHPYAHVKLDYIFYAHQKQFDGMQGAGYVNHEQNGLDIALAPEAEEIADTVEEMETPTVQPDKAGMVDVVEDTPRGLFQSPPEAVALSALSVGGIPDAAAEAASETVAPHTSNPAVSDSPAIVVADIDRSVADSEEQPEVDMVMPVEDTSADAGMLHSP